VVLLLIATDSRHYSASRPVLLSLSPTALARHGVPGVPSHLNKVRERPAQRSRPLLPTPLTYVLYDHGDADERLEGSVQGNRGNNGPGQGTLLL
jgi:hypothetical protein